MVVLASGGASALSIVRREPEHCAERLMRAHEEGGIEHVFLFPAHDMKTGYELPHAEVEAFGTTIGPRLAGC
jgi:5,10-methylenetetrahydromethanopterin reductase